MHAHAKIPLNFQLSSLPQGIGRNLAISTDKRDFCREVPCYLRERKSLSWLYMRSPSTLGGSSWLRRDFLLCREAPLLALSPWRMRRFISSWSSTRSARPTRIIRRRTRSSSCAHLRMCLRRRFVAPRCPPRRLSLRIATPASPRRSTRTRISSTASTWSSRRRGLAQAPPASSACRSRRSWHRRRRPSWPWRARAVGFWRCRRTTSRAR